MPTPKYRTSKSKKNMRRSHHALKAPGSSLCPNCGELKQTHRACGACGHYKGRQVIAAKTVTDWDGSGDFNTES